MCPGPSEPRNGRPAGLRISGCLWLHTGRGAARLSSNALKISLNGDFIKSRVIHPFARDGRLGLLEESGRCFWNFDCLSLLKTPRFVTDICLSISRYYLGIEAKGHEFRRSILLRLAGSRRPRVPPRQVVPLDVCHDISVCPSCRASRGSNRLFLGGRRQRCGSRRHGRGSSVL